MPIMPSSYYANLYSVNLLGQSLVAKKYDIKQDTGAEKKTFVQGSGAKLVQDIKPITYTQTFEFPVLLGINNNSNNANIVNSVYSLVMPILNGQINALNSGVPYNQNYFIEKYSLNASENELVETVVIKFSRNTDGSIPSLPGVIVGPPTPAPFYEPTRMAKNYDVTLSLSPLSPAFVESANFTVNFENSVHYFVNNSGYATFLIKSYDVDQKFSIIGGESYTQNIFNVTAGNFIDIAAYISLSIRNRTFYSYNLPLVVKSRTDDYQSGSLIKVDLDLSIYGKAGLSPFS
jgi:hypothetical protein